MNRKDINDSQYFQTIAHAFFKLRGAPFFLSSKDLDLIATWKKQAIPFSIVLEGIEKSFEKLGKNPSQKGKVLALSFCNLQVLGAFEQYRERRVGVKKKIETRDEKRKKIKTEVQRFLKHTPPSTRYLKEIYQEVLKMLSGQEMEEARLEQKEEEIETALLRNCLPEEKEKVKKEILAEYDNLDKVEILRLFKIRMIKFLRDKYKVPYISFYYY